MIEGTESAAPTSTADIAASVISDAEHADTATPDTGTETRVDTTNAAEVPAPESQTPPAPPELTAAQKFLQKQGHQAKKVDGRDVWLPYGTVEKMLDRYVDEHKTTWTGEKTTIEGRAKQLQDHLDLLRASVAGDETAFLRELAGIDPRYARFLEQKTAPAATATDDPEPQPDYDLGNGNRTYTIDGLAKREAWVRRQVERDILAKVDERFKPIAEREKSEQQRAEQAKAVQAIEARTAQQLTEAETWAGWADHKADILTALQEDSAEAAKTGDKPKLSLEGAYRKVVVAKLLEDDGKRRERLLKEIQAAPKSPALGRQSTDAPRTPGVRSTTEIARQTIAKLESGG
ncbi:MAG: hypothetical protein V4550_11530 [Gemmatimonadota bacterium]